MSPDPKRKRDESDVAALIRAAGPRPAVPKERSERVRAAAQLTWARELRRARQRRRLVMAGVLAVAASLVVAIGLRVLPLAGVRLAPQVQAGLVVESVTGTAWAGPVAGSDGGETLLTVGERLATDRELHTTAGARVALRLDTGHSVRLDHATRLRVLAGGQLYLSEGAIYVDSHDARTPKQPSSGATETARALTVQTPFGTIEEIGTQFEVRLAPAAVVVRLREGSVILHHRNDSYPVAVGTEFSLSADGSTGTGVVLADDARWSWAASVAPVFELEGRTARAFLDWVARERGLRLAFADTSLARSADEIILAGSLGNTTLDQALDVVLPTCRLSHRVADGVLVVEADAGQR